MIKHNVNPASSCYPGLPYENAIAHVIHRKAKDPLIQHYQTEHVQLCPQHKNFLENASCENLTETYPKTLFRLHANVKTSPELYIFDASNNLKDNKTKRYIKQLKYLNNSLKSTAYTYHAGRRKNSFSQMIDNVLTLQDYMKIPVGVEGLYPSNRDDWHISTLKEYEQLLSLDVFFVIDLSHLQIVAEFENTIPKDLTTALLEHKNCIEIHVSDNNLISDQHQLIATNRWWIEVLNNAKISSNNTIFIESDQRAKRKHDGL